jgi:hypothetical protein
MVDCNLRHHRPFVCGRYVRVDVRYSGRGPTASGDPAFTPKQATANNTAVSKAPDKSDAPDKRVFGVLPNYRTVQDTGNVAPIPARRKMWIAAKDTFDYPIWVMAAGFAGLYQIENQNPSFGQGAKGYFRRYGTSLADQMVGNMLTEGVFPVLLEDPRYFRRGWAQRPGWYSAARFS